MSKLRSPAVRHGRSLAPGAGLVIAALASLILWAMIAGIAAIV